MLLSTCPLPCLCLCLALSTIQATFTYRITLNIFDEVLMVTAPGTVTISQLQEVVSDDGYDPSLIAFCGPDGQELPSSAALNTYYPFTNKGEDGVRVVEWNVEYALVQIDYTFVTIQICPKSSPTGIVDRLNWNRIMLGLNVVSLAQAPRKQDTGFVPDFDGEILKLFDHGDALELNSTEFGMVILWSNGQKSGLWVPSPWMATPNDVRSAAIGRVPAPELLVFCGPDGDELVENRRLIEQGMGPPFDIGSNYFVRVQARDVLIDVPCCTHSNFKSVLARIRCRLKSTSVKFQGINPDDSVQLPFLTRVGEEPGAVLVAID